MSKQIAKIGKALQQLRGSGTEILSGTVVSVDTDNATISVLITGTDHPISGVMLNGISGNKNGLVIYPAVNSDVIIANVDGPGEYTLIRASTIDEADITIGNTKFKMDHDGFTIANHTEDLATILSDLMDKIVNLTVSTGTGPSGVPLNKTDFTQIKNRIQNLLQ